MQSYCFLEGTYVPCVAFCEVKEECLGEIYVMWFYWEGTKQSLASHLFRRSCVILPFQVWSIIEPLLVSNHQIFLEATSETQSLSGKDTMAMSLCSLLCGHPSLLGEWIK